MRILILTPYYLPDSGPSAPLFAMLAGALLRRGENSVTVIAAAPHYPSGRVQPGFRAKWVRRSVESGVVVLRVPVPSVNRANLSLRLLQLLIYQVGAVFVGLQEQYDVVIASNPFLMVGLPFALLALLRKKPSIYSIHDVYPDVGVQLGVFKRGWTVKLVSNLEAFCARRADFVRILSESFRLPALRLGVSPLKVRLIYDWVDTDLIRPLSRQNAFSMEHGLVDKFVVLYAGNIGLSQGLEHILNAAECLANQPEILFVFVGEGAGKSRLEKSALYRGLSNVLFLPFQPRARLPEVLAAANVSLVPLQKGIGKGSLPSKSFSILASGRPILASVDEDSDLALLVQRSGTGICVPPEDSGRLAEAILRIKGNPGLAACYGENGRRHALQYHSPEAAALEFERLLSAAVASHARGT